LSKRVVNLKVRSYITENTTRESSFMTLRL